MGVSEGVITINNCANFGDITSEDEMGCSIGGILGAGNPAVTATNLQSITDCLSAGDISVKKSYPGGIVGNYQRQNLKLTRCVVLGTVTELAAGNNGAYGGAVIGNINNSLNITFEDCYFNSAYKPIATWAGMRVDYGKLSFTVKATGKDDVSVEYTTGVNPSAVTNALKASGAWSYNAMIDVSAKQNLTALDWTDTENGWTLEQASGTDGDYIPMPAAVAELFKSGVIPPIEKDSGSTGDSTNQPDDESLVKKTYPLNSNTAGIKILGVRQLASDTQLNCDWTGSGFEMNIVHEGGDIVFYGGSTTPCYFRVYIDDNEALTVNGSVYHTIGAGSDEIVLADVPAGTHNIKVIKVTGYTLARAEFFRVNFAGSIQETAPADNDLYIEYVGDSISCGWGTIGAFGGAYTDQDATFAYPLMVSDRLGADWSVTALSGQGLCMGNPGVTRGYLYASALRSTSAEYAFERKADAVVINIGTNDFWSGDVTEAQFKAAYKAFLETVKAKNGNDCKILCLYNTMNDTYANSILAVCAELGGENAGIYTYKTAKTNNNLHPNIAEHKALANVVVEQLADILDIPEENIGEGIFGSNSDSGDTGGSGGNTDGGNSGGSTLPPIGGDNGGGQGGTIDKLPDTFDPGLIIGGGSNKPSDNKPSDGKDTGSETEVESDTDNTDTDGGGMEFSPEIIAAIALGALFVLSLALNIVLICMLAARKKKEKTDI
jgi:lysophospholipase L1-like esterase